MSLLMEALRKAEEANKNSSSHDNAVSPPQSNDAIAPEFDNDALVAERVEREGVTETADQATPVSATELADLLDQSDFEQAVPHAAVADTPIATGDTATPGPLSALRMSLALEPLAQAPGTPSLAAALDAVALSDHVPEDAMSGNEPAAPSQPEPTIQHDSTAADIPATAPTSIPAAAPVSPPTSGMQDDILAEFDQEFAALVKKIEQEEATSTPASTAAPVTAPMTAAPRVAAVATESAAFANTTSANKKAESRRAASETTAPARKAASTFVARGTLLTGRTAKIASAGVAAMVLLLGGGGYYVYTESMRLSQPMVFVPAALPAPHEDPSDPSQAGETAGAAIDTATTPVLAETNDTVLTPPPTEVIAKPDKRALASAAASATTEDTMEASTAPASTALAPQPATSTHTPLTVTAGALVASTPAAPAPHAADSSPSVAVTTGTNNVSVTRETHTPSQYQQHFATAFQAYQRGDIAAAAAAYEQALTIEPLSRDAMLGLAASAMRLGETQRARELYEQALRVAPNDAQATAGWLGLVSGSEPLRAESEIKFLLRRLPNVADLHFALGNVYIKQSKWGDAQQAFATAATLDPSNADYMFNLAVSHDQMGNRNKALDAYRTAQQLAAVKRAGFDPLALATRIRELSGPPAQAEGS